MLAAKFDVGSIVTTVASLDSEVVRATSGDMVILLLVKVVESIAKLNVIEIVLLTGTFVAPLAGSDDTIVKLGVLDEPYRAYAEANS